MSRNTRGWIVVTSCHLSSGANLCIEARLALQHAQHADSNQPGDSTEDHHCEQRIHHQAAAWHRARKRNERQANITLKEKHHGLQHIRSRGRQSDLPSLRSAAPPPRLTVFPRKGPPILRNPPPLPPHLGPFGPPPAPTRPGGCPFVFHPLCWILRSAARLYFFSCFSSLLFHLSCLLSILFLLLSSSPPPSTVSFPP